MTVYVEGAGNIHHGDQWTWCPDLWRYLHDRYAISSMLDVGCGEGHCVNFWRGLGVVAHGIDASLFNVHRAVTPISLHNLATPYVMPVDMVWCCEVVEHVEEQYLIPLLDTLMNAKRVIAMTHAVPDQPGYGHVNCQLPSYWIEKIIARGYHLSDDNNYFKTFGGSPNYFNRTGLVFLRND